jgi:hypothetical protein
LYLQDNVVAQHTSHLIAGDPVTDHGLLNPTYLEALLWEGKRYQSLYLSPIGIDSAFITPLTSSAAWFPDFAYKTTKQLIVSVLKLLIWLRELVTSIVVVSLRKNNKGSAHSTYKVTS